MEGVRARYFYKDIGFCFIVRFGSVNLSRSCAGICHAVETVNLSCSCANEFVA